MSSRALPDAARRGWCPGLRRPMPTGDGLLARIHPPLGVLSLAQARAVAEGAQRYGNGHLDLTARANLQIRGVSEATTAPLAALLDAAGLGDTRTDGGPQRLTLTSPLAGQDIAALASAIEVAGRAVLGLPPKTFVAVGMMLDEADLSVLPLEGGRVAIIAGLADGRPVGNVSSTDTPSTIRNLLAAFAATGQSRMRDVTAGMLAFSRHGEWSEAMTEVGWATGDASAVPGLSEQDGHPVLALDAPFGRCTVAAWERLIAVAERCGAPELRLSPSRGIVLRPTCLERVGLADLAGNFITTADDPRRAVAACTGAPACASGSTPTLLDAARVADAFRPLAARGLVAHVSGCAKGCAKPGPADLTLVGREGQYGIVIGGNPSDTLSLQVPIEAALERLGRAASVGLAAAFAPASIDIGRNRRPA